MNASMPSLTLQLQHFPSTRDGGEAPQFHSKRDCIPYLFFVFGAISRLERTISDEALAREWRNWRKSRICRGYYPKRATASFIKRYPKMLNSKLQNAFASGSFMPWTCRCAAPPARSPTRMPEGRSRAAAGVDH